MVHALPFSRALSLCHKASTLHQLLFTWSLAAYVGRAATENVVLFQEYVLNRHRMSVMVTEGMRGCQSVV